VAEGDAGNLTRDRAGRIVCDRATITATGGGASNLVTGTASGGSGSNLATIAGILVTGPSNAGMAAISVTNAGVVKAAYGYAIELSASV
jgi:hypothetical protein